MICLSPVSRPVHCRRYDAGRQIGKYMVYSDVPNKEVPDLAREFRHSSSASANACRATSLVGWN